MTCPHCGAPVLADAEVCPVCGTSLPSTLEAAQSGWPAPAAPTSPGYGAPNPYAPPLAVSYPSAGYPPPAGPPAGWAPGPPPAGPPPPPAYAPPGYPAAGYGPPGYPPASPYGGAPGGFPAAYPYAPPPRRSNAAFLWGGGGLLALSLFLCLCMGVVLIAASQDATTSARDLRDTQLGGAICLIGVFVVLSVPGLILLIVGLRRRV